VRTDGDDFSTEQGKFMKEYFQTVKIESIRWDTIPPEHAVGLDLSTDSDIQGPVNEHGVVCPWPWEVQQQTFQVGSLHTCSHCGSVGTPGLPHQDHRDLMEES